MRFKGQNEDGVQFGGVPRDRKTALWMCVRARSPSKTIAVRRRDPPLIGSVKARRGRSGLDRRSNEVWIEVSWAEMRGRDLEDVPEVETRYGSPSFTVDARSFSSFSVGRSTGLSSNVKRIYREVGQLPSRGTGFLTLPSLGNLKVNSRSPGSPRGWCEESAKFTVEKKRFRRETSAMNSTAVRRYT